MHVVNQGLAFVEVGDAMNLYAYNERGDVIEADRRWGSDPQQPGEAVAGQYFAYDYDPIGNRTYAERAGYGAEYAANELNQYTSRGVPGVAHLLGSADPDATVLVNAQTVIRRDGDAYWYKDLAVTNTAAAKYPEVVVDAVWSNLHSSVTGNVYVAKTPEGFTYDDDGNLTADGRFTYGWDGENRLVAIQASQAAVAAGAPNVLVNYAYDYMSRRIGKAVYAWENNDWTLTESRSRI